MPYHTVEQYRVGGDRKMSLERIRARRQVRRRLRKPASLAYCRLALLRAVDAAQADDAFRGFLWAIRQMQ